MSSGTAALPLQARVLRASGWMVIQHGASLSLRLASTLLMTRLLAPEAFGMMAVVHALMTGLWLISDLGLSQSIIVHERGNEEKFLNTAWTVQIIRGLIIWFASAACAWAIWFLAQVGWLKAGTAYADPQMPYIVVVFMFSVAIGGFESTKIQQARRNLQVAPIVVIDLATQLVALGIMLALASTFHSVWALAVGGLLPAIMRVGGSHWLLPGQKNRIAWEQDAWLDIVKFGKWIFLSSAIGFMVTSGDRMILGTMVDTTVLGVYSIAATLLTMAQMMFNAVVGSVIFPALSEVARSRPHDTRQSYTRFQFQVDVALFSLAGFLYMSGSGIVQILYDDRYSEAGFMLSILAVGLIGARYVVAEQGYLALEQAQYHVAASSSRALCLCAGVPLAFHAFGINGALAAIVATQFAAWPVAIYFENRNGLFGWKRALLGVPPLAIGAGLGWIGNHALRVL
jgi:O-antigen/teichoic acid export membrane protein